MRCEICGKGPEQGVTLIRQNEKGVKGVWRCRECNFKPLDPDEERLLKILEGK